MKGDKAILTAVKLLEATIVLFRVNGRKNINMKLSLSGIELEPLFE